MPVLQQQQQAGNEFRQSPGGGAVQLPQRSAVGEACELSGKLVDLTVAVAFEQFNPFRQGSL